MRSHGMPHSQEATAMNRPLRKFWSLVLSASLLAPGCAPQQPFYCREDGDLSHYLDVATEIEYPDVEEPSLNEVTSTLPPLTLKNTENYEMWDLSLRGSGADHAVQQPGDAATGRPRASRRLAGNDFAHAHQPGAP